MTTTKEVSPDAIADGSDTPIDAFTAEIIRLLTLIEKNTRKV